jgi:hypothetical protein
MDGDEGKVSTIPETASTRSRATAGSRDAADAPEHCAIYQLLDDLGTKTADRQDKMIKWEHQRLDLTFLAELRIVLFVRLHASTF